MKSSQSYFAFDDKEIAAPSQYPTFPDDIICEEWLEEINLPQYKETFLVNFSLGGPLISRKRLSKVRLQDFPKM
jgi:hypothetical protein